MGTKRIIWMLLVCALCLGVLSPSAFAAPYDSYNYNYWKDTVPAPAAYLPGQSYDGNRLGIGALADPQDLFIGADHRIYIADSGNARIVVLDPNWHVQRVISTFQHDGKTDRFKKPSGLYVKEDGTLYVADYDNQRIVVLAGDGAFIRQITNPQSDVLPQGFSFFPLKVAVDQADRVYVVAKGVFEGIMQFDNSGAFIGFLGTNTITPNLYEYFWKAISTKAQRSQLALFVPTEFTNFDLDDKGFVLATNIDKSTDTPIKRLNPSGSDVLKRYGYFAVKGDILFMLGSSDKSGPSQFMDVKAGPDGTFSALDLLRGRIFTYDNEGNLLYIFGLTGTQLGTFKTVTAIDRTDDDRFVVLDAGTGRVTVFDPTVFGSLINQANRLHSEGNELEASAVWRKVLSLDANYDIAYIGIGKSLLREHDYKEAMRFFKLGMNRKYYSAAYGLYRKQWAREHAGDILTGIVTLAALIVIWRLFRKYKNRRSLTGEA